MVDEQAAAIVADFVEKQLLHAHVGADRGLQVQAQREQQER